jgi:hypothetical protein
MRCFSHHIVALLYEVLVKDMSPRASTVPPPRYLRAPPAPPMQQPLVAPAPEEGAPPPLRLDPLRSPIAPRTNSFPPTFSSPTPKKGGGAPGPRDANSPREAAHPPPPHALRRRQEQPRARCAGCWHRRALRERPELLRRPRAHWLRAVQRDGLRAPVPLSSHRVLGHDGLRGPLPRLGPRPAPPRLPAPGAQARRPPPASSGRVAMTRSAVTLRRDTSP